MMCGLLGYCFQSLFWLKKTRELPAQAISCLLQETRYIFMPLNITLQWRGKP